MPHDFEVTVNRLVKQISIIKVTATNPDEAKERALELARLGVTWTDRFLVRDPEVNIGSDVIFIPGLY